MKRPRPPKLEIEPEPFDRLLDRLGFTLIIILVLMVAVSFSGLPELVPTHFDFSGEVTSTGSRYMLLLLPLMGAMTFMMIYFLNKAPHTFNYTVTITEENAAHEYRKATRMMRWVNLICALLFTFITFTTIATAHGFTKGLNSFIMTLIMAALFGVIGYYLLYDRIHKPENKV
ncbi:MAG: DUF1648 domain-containing protein [Candidatus Cyclonatronum sp.]|uniref:DUF1648 domain-containing protein n=1 Tax=Cyclonatronum sp. TaxID=3024185 RepID=UPI0025B84D8D|nr:DUF1648 domain-containing protein [Cyclonatronum sp.]MCH8486712.1 DUF1648 domain-containing protein [Cyclonatronum sp.]